MLCNLILANMAAEAPLVLDIISYVLTPITGFILTHNSVSCCSFEVIESEPWIHVGIEPACSADTAS